MLNNFHDFLGLKFLEQQLPIYNAQKMVEQWLSILTMIRLKQHIVFVGVVAETI